jgi:hypothetical protein
MLKVSEQLDKLTNIEKAEFLDALHEDEALNNYLEMQKLPIGIMEELAKRELAYKEGRMTTTSWDDLKSRLLSKYDAL